ncbi:MAG TPA: flagellar biosynthetic protein FliO [Symbiobacteriaceae bacterium]|nr:flagellar biosynthetic protein FliO [Symbiobacteriaceae bacterium]
MDDFLMLLEAVLLFGLVLGLAWLSTRMLGYRMGLATRGRMVRVLENVPAGRDRSIMLLEVGGRIYLVGSTSDRISLIDAIDDPGVIERVMAQAPEEQPSPLETMIPASFRDVLAKVRLPGRPGAEAQTKPADAAEAEGSEERLKQQLERLRKLQEKDK